MIGASKAKTGDELQADFSLLGKAMTMGHYSAHRPENYYGVFSSNLVMPAQIDALSERPQNAGLVFRNQLGLFPPAKTLIRLP